MHLNAATPPVLPLDRHARAGSKSLNVCVVPGHSFVLLVATFLPGIGTHRSEITTFKRNQVMNYYLFQPAVDASRLRISQKVWVVESRVEVQRSGFRIYGTWFEVEDLGFRVQGQ